MGAGPGVGGTGAGTGPGQVPGAGGQWVPVMGGNVMYHHTAHS